MEIYQFVFIGLWLILATIFFQAMVMISAHRAEKGYKVGKIDPDLGQESFFFRSYRTFWNSLENIVPILGMITVAILAGYSSCLLYTSPSPRDATLSRMPSSA